jgi:hypothetical protein
MNRDDQQAYERMVRAIKRRLNKQERRDVARHGADAGFSGFIYYTETRAFYRRHQEAIWALLCREADDLGEPNVFAMIAHFNGAPSVTDAATFENLMCWYALEYVCREEADR